MTSPAQAIAYAGGHRAQTLWELKTLIRFPSVSADPRHAGDVRRCAEWLAGRLQRIGLEGVRLLPAGRHPAVYGEWRHRPGRPTVLVYGHYDVQPVDPVGEWRLPPFVPTRHGDDLFGRGASDDKGQLSAHLAAIEAYLRGTGLLPVNLRCLLDGEEEIGSPGLWGLLRRNQGDLRADVVIVSDTRMLGPDRPAITYGLRGLLTLELEVRGPRGDLHAGTFGGAVHNPIQVLCELLASLHNNGGRVAVPGFYDEVRELSGRERRALARVGPSDAAILREAWAAGGWGERRFSLYERTTTRPAVTINGIGGGYQGPGSKSVIPARAAAKLGVRLVPDQDPVEIEQLLRDHLRRRAPATVTATVRAGARSAAVVLDPGDPVMGVAAAACERGFGARPAFLRSGGTIPAVSSLRTSLGVPVVLLGLGLPDDRVHAPNEKFHLPNLWRGTETLIWFLAGVGAGPGLGGRTATTSADPVHATQDVCLGDRRRLSHHGW